MFSRNIRFEALQSEAGKKLLQRSGRAPDDISSVVLVEKERYIIRVNIEVSAWYAACLPAHSVFWHPLHKWDNLLNPKPEDHLWIFFWWDVKGDNIGIGYNFDICFIILYLRTFISYTILVQKFYWILQNCCIKNDWFKVFSGPSFIFDWMNKC